MIRTRTELKDCWGRKTEQKKPHPSKQINKPTKPPTKKSPQLLSTPWLTEALSVTPRRREGPPQFPSATAKRDYTSLSLPCPEWLPISLLSLFCRINRKAPLHRSWSCWQRWEEGRQQSEAKQLVQEMWIQDVSTHAGVRCKAPEIGRKKQRSRLERVREEEGGKGSKVTISFHEKIFIVWGIQPCAYLSSAYPSFSSIHLLKVEKT